MTDQTPADVEGRVRIALTRLADSHRPQPDLHWPADHERGMARSSEPRSKSRWLLVAASVAIVAAGIGAVGLVQDRGAAPTVDTPATVAPSTTVLTSTTTVPDVGQLRFGEPLEPDVVATLDPAPGSTVSAYDSGVEGDESAFTRGDYTTVWVLTDNEFSGSLAVTDQAVPWEIATEGMSTKQIAGTQGVVDEEQSMVALRLDDGGTRVIRGGSDGPAQPEMLAAALELAAVIGTGPVDSVLPTDRFVSPVAVSAQSPVVRYGDNNDLNNTTEVVVSHLERSPSEHELRWMAAAMSQGNQPERIDAATFTAELDAGQQSLIELVSPIDVVAILAPASADMSELRDSLEFQPVSGSDLTVEHTNPYLTPNVIASGEADWGRWQVSTSADGRCRSVSYVLWTPGELSPNPTGTSSCDPEQPFGSAICAATGPGLQLVIVLGAEADAIAVKVNAAATSTPIENGSGGAAALIGGVPPGPDPVTVSVDGTDTNCTPT